MNIDWRKKLTSRKFWAAVVTFITALLAGFGVSELQTNQVAAIITAASAMIAYIIGEGLVDAAEVKARSENSMSDK